MGDCWDYRIKKVEIAQKLMEQKEHEQKFSSKPDLTVGQIKGSLFDAWKMQGGKRHTA